MAGYEARLPGEKDNQKGKKSDLIEETIRYMPYGKTKDVAFESIHVNGRPAFLCYDKQAICMKEKIIESDDEKTRNILQPVSEIPYEPFNFTAEEIDALANIAPEDAMGKAYEMIFKTISPFLDTDDQNLYIDSAAILFSYFQHKYKSTPYIFKLGAPEAGKTRSLRLVKWLAYRPMMAVAMTNANIYRYLGRDVDAAGTIIHDEAEDIHQSNDMISIYNDGYTLGSKVPRITGESQEHQSFFFSYCIKFFGGIELPKNNAFVSRCIVQQFMQGSPEKIDIEDEDEDVFRQLRKHLLVLRLLRAFDKLPKVNTGLRGRSRELYAPLLSVVQGTEWYKTLLSPLLKLDEERRRIDRESKPAYVAKAVIDCWLNTAKDELKLSAVELTVTDTKLDGIKEPLFIPNAFVVAGLGLEERMNEKGRKILVSDDLPFTFTSWEIGKIQSENLKGKGTNRRLNKKQQRGHLFELKTIRQLHLRYAETLETDDKKGGVKQEQSQGGNQGGKHEEKGQNIVNSKLDDENFTITDSYQTPITALTSVSSVSSVAAGEPKIDTKQRYFVDVFKALQRDSDTVNASALKRELISSGKFDAGDAHQTIQDNLEENTIYEVLPDEYKGAFQ